MTDIWTEVMVTIPEEDLAAVMSSSYDGPGFPVYSGDADELQRFVTIRQRPLTLVRLVVPGELDTVDMTGFIATNVPVPGGGRLNIYGDCPPVVRATGEQVRGARSAQVLWTVRPA